MTEEISHHSFASSSDILALISSLTGRGLEPRTLYSKLERLQEECSPFLDAFSLTESERRQQADVYELFCRREQDLRLAIMIIAVRLRSVSPRSLYVGRLLAILSRNLLGSRCSEPLSTLFERAGDLDPVTWELLRSSLRRLDASGAGCAWDRWPTEVQAREVMSGLDFVGPSWERTVAQLRSELRGEANRSRRRDPAFRRAIAWHQIMTGAFRRLAGPGGPARIIIDYCFTILKQFEASTTLARQTQSTNRAMCDLLILEVFGLLEQFALPSGDEYDLESPQLLEQGNSRRRKRIQRARLQVLTEWELQFGDAVWAGWAYRTLLGVEHRSRELIDPREASPVVTPTQH